MRMQDSISLNWHSHRWMIPEDWASSTQAKMEIIIAKSNGEVAKLLSVMGALHVELHNVVQKRLRFMQGPENVHAMGGISVAGVNVEPNATTEKLDCQKKKLEL